MTSLCTFVSWACLLLNSTDRLVMHMSCYAGFECADCVYSTNFLFQFGFVQCCLGCLKPSIVLSCLDVTSFVYQLIILCLIIFSSAYSHS